MMVSRDHIGKAVDTEAGPGIVDRIKGKYVLVVKMAWSGWKQEFHIDDVKFEDEKKGS